MQDEKRSTPGFYSGFFHLFSGLAVVQLLNFGFSLLLPRFYSPLDFALFGVFTSIVFILLELVALKLDVTIFFPKEDEESLEIVHAVFMVALGICLFILLTSVFVVFIYDRIYLLLPLSVLVYGLVLPLNAWYSRKKRYRVINTARIIQAFAIPLLSLAFIIIFNLGYGLILGFIVGQSAGLLYLFYGFKDFNSRLLTIAIARKYLMRYRRFPTYGVFSALVNSLAQNSLVLLIRFFFGTVAAGHFTLASRILRAPAGMYQSSVAQIFLADARQKSGRALYLYMKKMLWFGLLLGLVPVVVVLISGPSLFVWVFGEEWSSAGYMAQYLVLWIFSTAVISPVALLLDIRQQLRFEAGYNVFLLLFRVSAILAGVYMGDVYLGLLFVCIVSILMSVFLMWKVLEMAKKGC